MASNLQNETVGKYRTTYTRRLGGPPVWKYLVVNVLSVFTRSVCSILVYNVLKSKVDIDLAFRFRFASFRILVTGVTFFNTQNLL